MECLHHHPVRLCGQFGDLTGFGGVGSERFFAQHVLSGRQRGPGPPAVQAVRQRVVDRVQIRVGDQLVVVVVHPGDVVLGGEGPSARRIACRHRGHHDLAVFLSRVDQRQRCNLGSTQNADPQRGGSVSRHQPTLALRRINGRAISRCDVRFDCRVDVHGLATCLRLFIPVQRERRCPYVRYQSRTAFAHDARIVWSGNEWCRSASLLRTERADRLPAVGSTVIQAQERADSERLSAWAPLRNRIYRYLFIAQFVSNIGTWMQSVAAQWFLVEKHSSDVVVALVQTASLGPTLLLGLFAGALADLFDRRRFLMVLQSYAVLVTLALAVLTYLGRLGPTSLLMFTVAIGCAAALTGPAWQAIQPEVVPREQIPAAATLASVSANAARAIGPAVGGVAVALAGPAAVFAINAVSFAGIIVALRAWKRPRQSAPIEREHFGQAIISGLLYVRNAPIFRRILSRTALFPVSRVGSVGAVAGGCRPQVASGGQWLRCGVRRHRFWRRTRCRDRHTVTPEGVRRRAAGGVRRRVRGCAAGGDLAAVRCGDAFFGVVGDGLADDVDDVERGSAVVAAALGHGPRVVGVSPCLHGISGNRRVHVGCRRHAGGTPHRPALVGGGAGRCCAQRCRASVAAVHWEAERRGFQRVADTDARVRTMSQRWTGAGSGPLPSADREPRKLRRGDERGQAIAAANGRPQLAAVSQCGTTRHVPREVHRGVLVASSSVSAPSGGWISIRMALPRRSAIPSTTPESTATTSLCVCTDDVCSKYCALMCVSLLPPRPPKTPARPSQARQSRRTARSPCPRPPTHVAGMSPTASRTTAGSPAATS